MSPERKSTAAAAADRVRAVLEAAEQSAADLRAEAAQEIEGQLARAQTVAERLSGRADEIETALQRLADSVRDELSALKADLEELRAVKEGIGAVDVAPEPVPPVEPEPDPEPDPEPEPVPEPVVDEPTSSPTQGEGVEGARVIALNMALGGSTREETARYLSENFQLENPEPLLDEVYARVPG